MKNQNKYKHIIWDWNGTLINDAWLFVELMNQELETRNLPLISVSDYRAKFTFPVKKYYENLGFNFEKEDFEKVGLAFINKFKKRNKEPDLYENAYEVLKKIHTLGINQSIVSAQENNLLNETVRFYKLNNFFKHIAGIGHYYADDKISLAKNIRKKISCDNEEILVIGDSVHDYEVAKSLSVDCILFSNGHYSKKRLLKCRCDIIDNHLELLNYIS
tara:strand:+ start:1320 stop:1970 length:651 start_codon:yes stop_codon:yes gene_type:complete